MEVEVLVVVGVMMMMMMMMMIEQTLGVRVCSIMSVYLSVDVRVIRQSQYIMDKTRVALIRGRHKLDEINQNGN